LTCSKSEKIIFSTFSVGPNKRPLLSMYRFGDATCSLKVTNSLCLSIIEFIHFVQRIHT
jgi:hypothetical protein